jgi:hypothetical protein
MKMGNYVIGHALHLGSPRDIDALDTQRHRAAPY